MVFVPAGEYSLVNWSRSTEEKVNLDEFFIDKYEVSNAEFKEFVSRPAVTGKKNFGNIRSSKDGKEIPLEEALREFKDKTGLPAPRRGRIRHFPKAKTIFPLRISPGTKRRLTPNFAAKRLPTVFQWEKAARDGAFDPRYNAMPWGFIRQGETTDNRANFRGTGTFAVKGNEFGMSPFGAL